MAIYRAAVTCCIPLCRTNLTYAKSLQAVAGVLEVIKNKVPQCTEMVDGLLSAVRLSQVLWMVGGG